MARLGIYQKLERFLIKSFSIFVKAWSWFIATSWSRKTLCDSYRRRNKNPSKFSIWVSNSVKIKNAESEKLRRTKLWNYSKQKIRTWNVASNQNLKLRKNRKSELGTLRRTKLWNYSKQKIRTWNVAPNQTLKLHKNRK